MRDAPNLGDIFGNHRHSPAIAVIAVDAAGRQTTWSFAEIERQAKHVVSCLAARRLEPGARIGIVAANSVPMLYTYLAIMRAGYVAVPINYKQPGSIVEYICEDSSIDVCYADPEFAGKLPRSVEVLSFEMVPGAGAVPSGMPQDCGDGRAASELPRRDIDPEDPALILYTSGSTGKPKGVVLSHRSQLAMLPAAFGSTEVAIYDGQRGVVVAPMYHMNALLFIASFLSTGASIVLMAKFDGAMFIAALETYSVTVVTGVPTMISLMRSAWAETAQRTLPLVKTVYIGSSPVTPAIEQQAREMMPMARVINSYGTTEIGGGIFGPHPDGLPTPGTSVGCPRGHVEVHLEGGGAQGALVVKSKSMMSAYLNLPELTAKRLRDGWFNTGDLFRVDADGFYFFVGREDDMIVCSGENFYPSEVEMAIDEHAKVVQSVVISLPDEARGQIPVAFVVASEQSLTEDDVGAFLKDRIAPYMRPRCIWFVEQLPLSTTNKVDRSALVRLAATRWPASQGN